MLHLFLFLAIDCLLWLTMSKSILSKWVDFTPVTLGVFSCQAMQSSLSSISLPSGDNDISSSSESQLCNLPCEDLNHFPLIYLFPVLAGFTDKFSSSVFIRDLFLHSLISLLKLLSFVFRSAHTLNMFYNMKNTSRRTVSTKISHYLEDAEGFLLFSQTCFFSEQITS